jgi:hypothetical protein
VINKFICSHYTFEDDQLGDDEMTVNKSSAEKIDVYLATAERWLDLETLFGKHGVCFGVCAEKFFTSLAVKTGNLH